MTQQYVAGFMFSEYDQFVALIEKIKPEWQKGKLNGIGGKIEEGESPMQAMRREFQEETGINHSEWRQFATISGFGYIVYFFMARTTLALLHSLQSITDEQIRVIPTSYIHKPSTPVIQNLRWLIPMALDNISASVVNHVTPA